jgi:hypothetical protein
MLSGTAAVVLAAFQLGDAAADFPDVLASVEYILAKYC